MASLRIAFLGLVHLLAIINLPLSASRDLSKFGGYGSAYPGGVGPYDANASQFLNAVDTSSATGLFKIPGYDVSKPYSGEPMEDWTISIAALQLTRSHWYREVDAGPWGQNQSAMLGHSIKIQAPDSLTKTNADGTKTVNTDPTWGMCMWDWGLVSHQNKTRWNNPDNKPLAADGSCKGFIPDTCITALEKVASTSYTLYNSSTTKGHTKYGSPVGCYHLIIMSNACGSYNNSTPDNLHTNTASY
jgi:hypothetical protein